MTDSTLKLVPVSVRLPDVLRQQLDLEFRRQARKKEFVVSCALNHFLRLPLSERDRICAQGYQLPSPPPAPPPKPAPQPTNGKQKGACP